MLKLDEAINKIVYFHKKCQIDPQNFIDTSDHLIKELEKSSSLAIKKNFDSNALVIFNSERSFTENELTKAISRFENLRGNDIPSLTYLDVSKKNGPWKISQIIRFTLLQGARSFFKNKLTFKNSFFSNLVESIFLNNRYIRVYFFTSNNRLTETYRTISISKGAECVEFLHGITSDIFGQYLKVLNIFAKKTHGKITYINMFPYLPQPRSIEKFLFSHDGKQVYFRNEKQWNPKFENSFDVLIVGGNSPSSIPYYKTEEFLFEINAMNEIIESGKTIVYCPHPNNIGKIEKFVPNKASIFPVSEVINSSKLVVGNFSTVLFTAHLTGKHVLVSKSNWKTIPSNLQAIFDDKNSHTYSIDRVNYIFKNKIFQNNSHKLQGIEITI